ncbi:MAG: thioredoxin 2 [Methanocella sp. PtaU1.Bin125]|nr:MAG: thioredoxin 2 [Methanocella sp. PtaU1.Bin125]
MQRLLRALLVVLAIALSSSAGTGCTGIDTSGNSKADEIDYALRDGPVLVEFGAAWCGWCGEQQPVIESLSRNITGVTFISVDVDVNASLADEYYVEGVPQMNLIVKKNDDGSYVYVDRSGRSTTDRFRSRLVGFMEYDELKPLVEAALAVR